MLREEIYMEINLEFKKGEYTDRLYEELCFGDTFDMQEFEIEELKKVICWDDCPVFIDGVVSRLNALGVRCNSEDTKLILKEVNQRYKERIGEICPRTIQDWIRGTYPSVNNRENNYNLCYALEMDLYETADFFRKYYLTNPFHYKDKTDAIFFYCLLHKKPYSVIKDMLEKSAKFSYAKSNHTKTMEIGRYIAQIDDEDEFINYLSVHCYDNELQYQVAREEIIELIDKHNIEKISELHKNVMGFHYQATSQMERLHELPKEFLKSLPTDRTFIDIKKGKKETYETLRKTLIILVFYDFYVAAQKADDNPDESTIRENLWDFYETVNEKLVKCGFVPLYERHPFDKLILFCGANKYPIVTFHGLNDLRYAEE